MTAQAASNAPTWLPEPQCKRLKIDGQPRATAVHLLQRHWSLVTGTDVGTRQPTGDPTWVTLEVQKGGFATKNRAAQLPPSGDEWTASNIPWLSEEGRERLDALLDSGEYTLRQPENGALLCVRWLQRNGHDGRAEEVLRAIAPYLDALQFFPFPTPGTTVPLAAVSVITKKECVDHLASRRSSHTRRCSQLLVFIDSVVPLRAEGISLALEMAPPEGSARDLPLCAAAAQSHVAQDWPARVADWKRRVLHASKNEFWSPKQLAKEKSTLGVLYRILPKAAGKWSVSVDRRELGLLKKSVSDHVGKHGAPDSAAYNTFTAGSQKTRPSFEPKGAKVVMNRLQNMPEMFGFGEIGEVIAPYSAAEVGEASPAVGRPVSAALVKTVHRACAGSIDELLKRKLIVSADQLADIAPKVQAASVAAAGTRDPSAQKLLVLLYRAFRSRRSLLLLNLQSQVRITELPWYEHLNNATKPPATETTTEESHEARKAVSLVVRLLWHHFPETILPNKFVSALWGMYEAAGIKYVPLTSELAADIFCGFSETFARAGAEAALLLKGTIYERYYATASIAADLVEYASRTACPGFQETIEAYGSALSVLTPQDGYSTKYQGQLIELQQVVTTHNLATMYQRLSEEERVAIPYGHYLLTLRSLDDALQAAWEKVKILPESVLTTLRSQYLDRLNWAAEPELDCTSPAPRSPTLGWFGQKLPVLTKKQVSMS
eukprot:gene16835-25817_t